MKTLGLYIHVPFCKSKCGYCDFNSYAGKEQRAEAYFSALKKEIKAASEDDVAVDTIYFGGGTPTFVSPRYIAETIETAKEYFEQCSNAEITVECNPGTIDFKGLKELRSAGVNRLSIGLQSADHSLHY